MNNKKKKYVGSFADEKDAAVLYDKVAILTHGLKVNHYLLLIRVFIYIIGENKLWIQQKLTNRNFEREYKYGLNQDHHKLSLQ